jgi:hypothetical protein
MDLPLDIVKQHVYSELLERRREYKYELKNSLNIHLGEFVEHVIATTNPQYISNPVGFEAGVQY